MSDPSNSELNSEDAETPGLPPGTKSIGHFKILRPLGKGAQGAVYLAEDTLLHRNVALKALLGGAVQSDEVRARFQREAEATSKLNHPGICGVHEVGEVDGVPFIAMQYVKGKTLAKLIEDTRAALGAAQKESPGANTRSVTSSVTLRGGSSLHDVLKVVEQAARALNVAHSAGLVHRDIKPANIMITDEGDPVLLDFGLARDLDAATVALTQTGQIMGTPAYLAPEQIRSKLNPVDRRTDVYALGVTLYECLSLRRPFEATTFQELFHKILEEIPADPRKFNPRIPAELRTVIETAMERDSGRRYQSALDFAEDLRRVRSFEPIRAKPASMWIRGRKWVQRNPSRSVAIASTSLFVVIGAAFWVGEGIGRRQFVHAELAVAQEALTKGQLDDAMEALARAEARDPELSRSSGLDAIRANVDRAREQLVQDAKKANDLASAETARKESAIAQEKYAQAIGAAAELRQAVSQQRSSVFSRYAPPEIRAQYAHRELELTLKEAETERLLQEAQEGLQRAARFESPWGGMSRDTESAFAAFYFLQWERAELERDTIRSSWLRSQVERFDTTGKYRDELVGRGKLTVLPTPSNAVVHMFRYAPLESLKTTQVLPRLVPVPTSGIGILPVDKQACGFGPGALAWEVLSVESDSPAARESLKPGDFVVAIQGNDCGEGLFVSKASEESTKVGIKPYMRATSVNNLNIRRRYDLENAPKADVDGLDRIAFASSETPITINRNSIHWDEADILLQREAWEDLRVHCIRNGECIDLVIPKGERSGIECRRTAYPAVCLDKNQIAAGGPAPMDPGSYLLIARSPGYVDQRVPVVVHRKESVEIRFDLVKRETVPDGYVSIPAIPFQIHGDPLAFDPCPSATTTTSQFCIALKEVTNEEWFTFVNDPESLKRIKNIRSRTYLPREPSKILAKENGGGGYTWLRGNPNTPVYGISWSDANDFIAWKNRHAESINEPWNYDFPTQIEWEAAARGADGREFPWGSRFDHSLTMGMYNRSELLLDENGGFEPRDESPFGVIDMAGSRREFTKDRVEGLNPPAYYTRSAFWGQGSEIAFRAASRAFANADYAGGDTGLRLVARRRN